jgi:hypothetical protein
MAVTLYLTLTRELAAAVAVHGEVRDQVRMGLTAVRAAVVLSSQVQVQVDPQRRIVIAELVLVLVAVMVMLLLAQAVAVAELDQ